MSDFELDDLPYCDALLHSFYTTVTECELKEGDTLNEIVAFDGMIKPYQITKIKEIETVATSPETILYKIWYRK